MMLDELSLLQLYVNTLRFLIVNGEKMSLFVIQKISKMSLLIKGKERSLEKIFFLCHVYLELEKGEEGRKKGGRKGTSTIYSKDIYE